MIRLFQIYTTKCASEKKWEIGKYSMELWSCEIRWLTLSYGPPGEKQDATSPTACRTHISLCSLRIYSASKGQTPLQTHRLRTCCTITPTDTTNGRAHNNSATNLPHRNARAQHLDMSRCWDVANFCSLVVNLLYNKLLWACPLVVSVGGVRSRCPCSGVWH